MDMAELMNVIDGVRKHYSLTQEKFAGRVGLTLNTYSRQKRGALRVGLDSVRLYATFAFQNNETEMLQALSEYALGINKTNQ